VRKGHLADVGGLLLRHGDEIAFETSLFPKDGGYLLPLKDVVRKPQRLSAGDDVTVKMTVRLRSRQ
jgi:hypothetical protein